MIKEGDPRKTLGFLTDRQISFYRLSDKFSSGLLFTELFEVRVDNIFREIFVEVSKAKWVCGNLSISGFDMDVLRMSELNRTVLELQT